MHIHSSAPTRIDLAGGTLDIWPLYLFHDGAQTINAAISIRAHARLDMRTDGLVEIRSVDTGRAVPATRPEALATDTTLPLLSRLLRFFEAGNVTLTTQSDSPAGAGLAGSSALNIAVCGALARWKGASNRRRDDLLLTAMNVEAQVLGVPTGVQDYRPALFGGIAAIELRVDGIHREPLDVDPAELQRRLVLAYTGAPRNSGTNNWEIMKRHLDGDRAVFDRFERIRDTAAAMREALTRGDWARTGRLIAEEWDNRRQLAPGVTTPAIDALIGRALRAGALSAKVCGAGGGGCLICYAQPDGLPAVREALAAGGARLLEFEIDLEGLRIG
ncbi:MAG TPA: hypothetical protein VNE16_11450 [Vicinamibacterales bacterium]|nr:hypothetical protein [Vicinamibacterales bacterium]